MTTNEMHQTLDRLDGIIDETEHAALLLALGFLRRTMLKFWLINQCCNMDAQALLRELNGLMAICLKGQWHPALPSLLCRVVARICAPALEAQEEIRTQCQRQAELIRTLRAWQPLMEAVLTHYDDHIVQEVRDVMKDETAMMEEVFSRYLSLYRSSMIKQEMQHRNQCLEQIREYRKQLELQALTDQVTQTNVRNKMLDEKFSSLSADNL